MGAREPVRLVTGHVPGLDAQAGETATAAAVAAQARMTPAVRLLRHEAEIRQLGSEQELLFHLANEVRNLVQYGSGMVLRRRRETKRLRIVQVSDLPDVDRNAPLMRALEERIVALDGTGILAEPHAFVATSPDAAGPDAALLAEYPLRNLHWLPLAHGGAPCDAGVVFARAEPFSPGEQTLLARLAATYAHAWAALAKRRPLATGFTIDRRRLGYAALALLALAVFPVRLSVMAPVEVIAASPFVVTAPIAGVVRKLLVPPNTPVTTGQPLVQFEDIQPRNEMVLAEQRLAVARARDTRFGAAAFRDPTAAHDMAEAHAELALAEVTFQYAREVLQRTRVDAPSDGIAIYTDRRDWEGRAVQVGEEIMQVADPARLAFRVDLATGNGIDLAPADEADIYLESAPLGGLTARLRSVSYTPKPQPGGTTSYTVIADPLPGQTARIGARGTARLYGSRVPLAFQLLRRPIAATRQFLGL